MTRKRYLGERTDAMYEAEKRERGGGNNGESMINRGGDTEKNTKENKRNG